MNARQYFIHRDEGYEGPFDLTMIMRKVRAGKIEAVTRISISDDTTPRAASEYPEIASLLHALHENAGSNENPRRIRADRRLRRALIAGWKFVSMQPFVCVYAGTGAIMAFALVILTSSILPWQATLVLGLLSYFMLQSIVMVTVLRRYRGQYLDTFFLREQLAPSLSRLLGASLLIGVSGAAGLVLGILPGLIFFSLWAFIPFLIADRGMDLTAAFNASPRICLRDGAESFGAVLMLVTLSLLSLFLIIPLPLAIPIFAVALAELYDDLWH